jgi:hypothetical protein
VSFVRLHSFRILTCPSQFHLQGSECPRPVAFFSCRDMCLPMRSPVGGCCSIAFFPVLTRPFLCGLQLVSVPRSVFSFRVLTCPFRCGLQLVSAPFSVVFFLCPDLFFPMRSPESECPWHSRILCFDLSLPLSSSGCEFSFLVRFPSIF